jgi:hypothetical protein
MGMTSEQVHWLYGALLAGFSVPMLLHARGIVKARWPEFTIGMGLLLFGLGLIFDPFLHGGAGPGDYAAETAQHLTLGIVLLLGSGFELFRAATRRQTFLWRAPLVLALLAASLTFLVHAQHEAGVSMLLLVTQHRFIAATLLVLASAVLLAPVGDARARGVAIPLLTLLLGLELLVYTEGDSPFGVPMETHQQAGAGGH